MRFNAREIASGIIRSLCAVLVTRWNHASRRHRDGAAAAAAHEIGHAMGLGHLGGYDLMHTEIRSNTLTDDDKAAFRAVWN
jgi:predicted Zn-dependent protease